MRGPGHVPSRIACVSGKMPPWPIDKTVGIQQFTNDLSLSDHDVDAIARWVDAGAPQGNPADMPPPVKWPDYVNSWRYQERFGRPPDLIVESPAYNVAANGMDQFPPMQTKVAGLVDGAMDSRDRDQAGQPARAGTCFTTRTRV